MFRLWLTLFPLLSLLRFMASDGDDDTTPDTTVDRDADRASQLAAKHDALKLALMVIKREGENARYRDEIRTLKERTLPDGAAVLQGDDLTRWTRYQELGTPDDLQTRLAERDTLADRLAAHDRAATVRKVAELTGWKADVLADVGANVAYEIREIDEQGQKVEKAFVKKDEGDPVPVEQHFQKLLPALQQDQPRRGDGIGTPPRPQPRPVVPDSAPGVPLVRL